MSVETTALPAARSTPLREARLSVPDLLLPLAVALWLIGVNAAEPSAVGGLGLIPALPVVYFVGIGVVVVSASLLLAAPQPSNSRLCLHVLALVVMLYGTTPLIYGEPRYSWLYQHVGVVDYIDVNEGLDRNIDLFHHWPGFFALAAWFDRVAGISNPLEVAAWAQLFFNLLLCLVLAFALRALDLTWRERWLALLVFATANWIGQDYFSPQATGFVLSIGVFAIALHWCRVDRPPPWLRQLTSRLRRFRAIDADPSPEVTEPTSRRRRRASPPALPVAIAALVLADAALIVVHELSPYAVAIQFIALTLVGQLRPRWIGPLLLLLALAFLAPSFTFVERNYGLLNSIGQFFGNIRPPSELGLHLSDNQLLVARASRLLSVFVWALAVAGAYRRFRAGRPVLVLLVLAFAPFLLLAVQDYGGEALLRVELFSLPWSAGLAACALAPRPGRARNLAWMPCAFGLLVTVGLFLPSYFGADGINRMPPGAVEASDYLYSHAQPGTIIYLDKNFPTSSNARYAQFDSIFLLDRESRPRTPLSPDGVPSITGIASEAIAGGGSAYLVLSDNMLVYAREYGLTSSNSLRPLKRAIDRSGDWSVFYRNGETVIYELR